MNELAVADNLRCSRRHFLESFNSLLCFAFLVYAENSVENNNSEDDEGVCESVERKTVGHNLERTAYNRSNKKNDYHRVCELFEEANKKRILFAFFKLVFAVFGESFLRFSRCKTFSRALCAFQHGFNGFAIELHKILLKYFLLDLSKQKRLIDRFDLSISLVISFKPGS